jgi:hypothetical protein
LTGELCLLVTSLTLNLDHSEELLRAVRIAITGYDGRSRLITPSGPVPRHHHVGHICLATIARSGLSVLCV